MRTIRDIALDLYLCADSWDPDVCLLGNVTARELAALARHVVETPALLERETVQGAIKNVRELRERVQRETAAIQEETRKLDERSAKLRAPLSDQARAELRAMLEAQADDAEKKDKPS